MTRFDSLLIANRGEIVTRVARTAQAMGLKVIAVASDADRNAPHTRACDAVMPIGGERPADSYLRIDKLIAAAHASGAQAVHPGYGFLSENAAFAQAVIAAGLVWVGPPPAAMLAMADKSRARQRMAAAGVPVLPGYDGDDQRPSALRNAALLTGFPLMVKASAGGGGRGMRLVMDESTLDAALASAASEAQAAFGDARLLIERALPITRHVEIQVFADTHGNVIHLGERDCSVQRRHQKVVEEAPSPAVNADLRARMGAAAVAAARTIGYRGAGTVEFLLAGDGAFYFLEMNTRLQVEHPVTEAITGLDLVEWQLRVARGEALPLSQEQVSFKGHAIEVRLYAEDAYAGFLPQTGRIDIWRPASGPGVRIDHGIKDGLAISPFYDPMIAKVIAHGATREEARLRLVKALRDTIVLGPTTNRHFLIRVLEHPEFAAGQATTAFLGKHTFAAPEIADRHWKLAASLLWRQSAARYPAALRGWRNSNPQATPIRLAVDATERLIEIGAADIDGETPPFHIDGHDIVVDLDAFTVRFIDKTYAPPPSAAAGSDGKLRAPMDGRIIAVKVAPGEKVVRGQTVVVLEAMKIQHQLKAVLDAEVESIAVQEGQQVANRTVLVTMKA